MKGWYRKLYTWRFLHWLYQLLRKDKILITYSIDKNTLRFEEHMVIAHVTTAQAYGMGYTRGKKIKDEFKYLPFKIFVRFTPDEQPPFPVMVMCEDGSIIENHETSSTLYDHWKSDSQKNFIKGTTKTVLGGGDQKTLVLIFLIVAGACAAIYFLFFR